MTQTKDTVLTIDSSHSDSTEVTLQVSGTKYVKRIDSHNLKSQVVLPLVKQLFDEQGLNATDIGRIEVKTGPGSFTGLRVGIAIANALSFLLDVPVNGDKRFALPAY